MDCELISHAKLVYLKLFSQRFLKNKSTAAFRKLASSKRLIVNSAEKAGRWVNGSSVQTDELAGEEDIADMLEVMNNLQTWVQIPIQTANQMATLHYVELFTLHGV